MKIYTTRARSGARITGTVIQTTGGYTVTPFVERGNADGWRLMDRIYVSLAGLLKAAERRGYNAEL
jgi:hypothetical protein